jgi:predicted GTPase
MILGAAGRDFHDFNVYWKERPDIEVVRFTARRYRTSMTVRIFP